VNDTRFDRQGCDSENHITVHESFSSDRQGRLAVSVDEASELLGISKWLGYEMVAQGKLPALRLGRRLVIPLSALERLLDSAVCRLSE
jgi:excisionase family DNA binding protein